MAVNELHSNLIHRVNVGDSLTRSAARSSSSLALVQGDRRLTYAELNEQVNRVANSLTERGISGGDAIALASGNSIEFLVTYYACAKIGAVCVPINLGWREEEVTYVLADADARLLVVAAPLAERMAPSVAASDGIVAVVLIGESDADFGPRHVHPFTDLTGHADAREPEHLIDDRAPLTYLYTSGTTSFPKGVVGNHTAIYLESMTMALEGQFRADDRFAAMLPMFHTAQLNCHCTTAIMVGATMHILPGFDAETLLTLIETESITQIFGLPMMYRAMLEHESIGRRKLSSLRRALYAMAPMPQDMLEKCIEVFDCGFYLLFGQTEMSPTATIFRPENQLSHPGAAGTAVVNVQVAIMAEDGTLLPQGDTGEIVYRGPHTMTEYLGNPDATEEAFRHGWFHSGDIGHLGEDGILWFTDRRKDVIKTGGENVASIEVEKALYAAEPGAAEVVVVGLPHEDWSEAITAFVVPKPGHQLDPEAIRTAMRERIDAYKIPKSIVFLESLPKTSTGKIQKNVIRDRHADHYGAAAAR
ncbi:MAG: fadD5 [Naasia sp.]|jgi:acyl-CoA synthetase (AMP-forming)/AMP-acid ligase II|uniref:class I adenylate-forming enzyme family protein n=1 Tax=Naasia sp. TaxID=2546198 RepID=UPI00261308D3|nr:long-chain-fatty-acid--CoA ligase [Naasia sp.]MCU1569516.1 fadD5 [Naasia sp.]